MQSPTTLLSLSPARKKLVQQVHSLQFGRIENLRVLNGEPLLDPPPDFVREVKLGRESWPPVQPRTSDYALKSAVEDLFRELDRIGTGVVDCIEVRHGLPVRVVTKDRIMK